MFLQRFFHFPTRDADVSLCHGDGAVLQQLLHQGDIVIVILVDLGCEEFPERMGADILIAQIVRHLLQMFLDGARRDREHKIILADVVFEAVDLHKLIDHERHRERPLLLGLCLHDIQAVSGAILDDVAQAQAENVLYAEPKVRLQHQACRDPVVWPESRSSLPHGSYDLLILFFR